MQILLNSDKNTDGSEEMTAHVQGVVDDAMGRFAESITRVEVYLSDANSAAKASPDDIHCKMEARLVHRDPIVVTDHAATAHQAINGAAGKLKRAVTTALGKHDPRHTVDPLAKLEADPTIDYPAVE
jgi:ribosome-associated translation inhibitor RaiA